jgi:hypothetical protein
MITDQKFQNKLTREIVTYVLCAPDNSINRTGDKIVVYKDRRLDYQSMEETEFHKKFIIHK